MCRLSSATYRDYGNTSSAAGSRQQIIRRAARDRRNGMTFRRNERSHKSRLPHRGRRSRRVHRGKAPYEGRSGCRALMFAAAALHWPYLDAAVERTADHILLLLSGKTDEIDGVSGYADGQLRIFSGMFHRILKHFLVDKIQVHVEAAAIKINIERLYRGVDEVTIGKVRFLRGNRDRVADPVQRVSVGQLRHRQAGSKPAVAVASVHRIGAGS